MLILKCIQFFFFKKKKKKDEYEIESRVLEEASKLSFIIFMGFLALNGFLFLEQIKRTLLFPLSTPSVYIRYTEFVEKKNKRP